jgi:hypothetical protein
MKCVEFKKAINLYCELAESLTPEELEGLMHFLEENLQEKLSHGEREKFDREYSYFINQWFDKYPEEMQALYKKIESAHKDQK